MIQVLQQLITTAFEQESEHKQNLADIVFKFTSLIVQFPLGIRANNVEIAISCDRLILKFYTREVFPQKWAMVQNDLGNAYKNRLTGDRKENIEFAIACHIEALKVYTKSDFPVDWAIIQYNLGNAYSNRIAGDRKENIETAISYYNAAVSIITKANLPQKLASINIGLGNAYSNRLIEDKSKNIESAISYYNAAVSIITKANFPSEWAASQCNLGIAYSNRIAGDRRENIEEAIACYIEALKVYTEADFPQLWATVQIALGLAYSKRIAGVRRENIEEAIAYQKAALTIKTELDFPYDWAANQNNLGLSYWNRIAGDKRENIETAIYYYKNALRVRTESDFPYDWATTQHNLGNAYWSRIEGNRKDNIETAINCYTKALKIYTEANFPQLWATVRVGIGNAYYNRIQGDRRDNIEDAIKCYTSAESIITKLDFPYDWSLIQHNLGVAYSDRIAGNRKENSESAITCFTETLKVRTESDYPIEWAETQNNLGNAYRDRIAGDRKQNIESAISYYQAALTINTPKTNPIKCLETSSNLGNFAFIQSDWQLAIDAYFQAIEAVETSRTQSISDDRRLQIQNEAINIYHNIVQSYINIGQIDKAIEYTERSRSRTLVDLIASNDLYGDREIPPQVKEFLQQFDQLQQEIDSERLRTRKDNQSDRPQDNSRAAWQAYNDKISDLEAQKLQIWQEIRKLDPILAGEIKIDPPNFVSIQKLIESQTAIISFYTTSQDTHIFILFKDKPPQLHTCLGQGLEILQDWIYQSWLLPYANINKVEKQEGDRTRQEWRDRIEPFLTELSQRLQINQIITQYLDDIKELIIIPNLYLHQIPFAALPIPSNDSPPIQAGLGERLSDRFHIRHIPSCQILQFCQERDNELTQTTKIGTVEDADGTLPGANLEGEKIAQLFNIPDNQRLRGSTQATVINYRQLAKQVNILHSSHHAKSNLDKPLESILVLGGTITLGELLTPGWRLRNLTDVFLSCCETNLGKSEIADDIFTLATGFLCAGAKSVVSTLWAVDDLSTALFCIFYYQLRQSGVSRSQAVCKAQEKLRTMTKEELHSYLQQEFRQAETEYKQVKQKMKNLKGTPEYQELAAEKENIDKIAKNLRKLFKEAEENCQQQFPFEHPFYWAGFISQGIR